MAQVNINYFGARYRSDISVWLSVDPLTSKYPNMSPYAYVFNNPINFIDRWGLEGDPIKQKYTITGPLITAQKPTKPTKNNSSSTCNSYFRAQHSNYISNNQQTSNNNNQQFNNNVDRLKQTNSTTVASVAQDALDITSTVLTHPGTSLTLQYGDDALRAIGLLKAVPPLNISANFLSLYVVTSDLGNPEMSFERKTYHTISNGVPLSLSVGVMIGLFGSGTGEAAVIIGSFGYVGEQVYDRVISPGIEYAAWKMVEYENWINSYEGLGSMYSDKRLKDNIKPLDSSLYKLLILNGYSYNWKDTIYSDNSKNDIGLIAQEVERVYPELVTTDSLGFKKIYYYKLIPVLIEALKVQQILIDSQNVLLKEYQNKLEYNDKVLNEVLIRIEELEIR